MRLRRRTWKLVLVVLAGILVAGPLLSWMAQAPQTPLPSELVGEDGQLPDGVYAVLAEGETFEAVGGIKERHRVLQHDGKYSDVNTKYVSLGLCSFVPLQLERAPHVSPGSNGFTSLQLSLASRYTAALEDFTTQHARIAIVIDGAVVTKHKVREPIRDGRVQISRCQDEACQVLYMKLTE